MSISILGQSSRILTRSTLVNLTNINQTRSFFNFWSSSKEPQSNMTSSPLYNLSAPMPNGSEFKFSETKNKVLLIVNVASKCGFTPQYDGLEKLWKKYKDQDFLIIAFPSNNFGQQEPGTDAEVASFCKLNYGVSFPIMKKCDVNGDSASEVYKFLKKEKAGVLGLSRIKWNFEKFLVDRNGHVRHRHASLTTPEALETEIEALLKESAKA